MNVGEHRVRACFRLLVPAFVLVAAVWLLRLIMAAANTPSWLTRLASVTVAATVSVLLTVLLIHVRRFGGYLTVVVVSLLINAWAQVLIILSILFSIMTGTENIYTAPEYSYGLSKWAHLYGHLTSGIAAGTLIVAAEGCLLLWLLRKLVPETRPRDAGAPEHIRPQG